MDADTTQREPVILRATIVKDAMGAEVGEVVHLDDGTASLWADRPLAERLDGLILGAGYTQEAAKEPAEPQDEPEIRLEATCEVENKRPCDLRSAVGFGVNLAQTANMPVPPKLDAIYQRGTATESEVRAALHELRDTVPEDRRDEAQGWLELAFPDEAPKS